MCNVDLIALQDQFTAIECVARKTGEVEDKVDMLHDEFEIFKHDILRNFSVLISKVQECARINEMIDESGASLDEFLESFRRAQA